jgi:hypothetical protein
LKQTLSLLKRDERVFHNEKFSEGVLITSLTSTCPRRIELLRLQPLARLNPPPLQEEELFEKQAKTAVPLEEGRESFS